MATLTIRDFDDRLKAELRVRAARHGQSMEAEVREILRAALTGSASTAGIGSRIHQRFSDVDDVSVPIPSRSEAPRAAELPE
ncbi:FitA-like ribbon-helix-helix domain-containing protein [Amycolatopsis taiwanensis]|uniref:FitA-like ribbon-helix-helix domain-containing protein n=1 Tax=Amycolatopsis taiwanensis TaxID=342230 RepID=UPI00047F9EAF|nr:plasmid stabilization protein [Amycolatopsis taiwanensis]